MPVIWEQSKGDSLINIWHSIEPLTELRQNANLNEKEVRTYDSFSSESRQREWLTVRNMLKQMHVDSSDISYDKNRKPFLTERSISISHSQDRVAVMTSPYKRIGIDIEHIHPRIKILAKKFLGEEERKNAKDSIEELHIYWGAKKEVLYKIHSIGGIDFKNDFFVHQFTPSNNGIIQAEIRLKNFEEKFNIEYEKVGGFMVAWNSGENEE